MGVKTLGVKTDTDTAGLEKDADVTHMLRSSAEDATQWYVRLDVCRGFSGDDDAGWSSEAPPASATAAPGLASRFWGAAGAVTSK